MSTFELKPITVYFGTIVNYEPKRVERLTPAELVERYEAELRGMGAVGEQLIRKAHGGRL